LTKASADFTKALAQTSDQWAFGSNFSGNYSFCSKGSYILLSELYFDIFTYKSVNAPLELTLPTYTSKRPLPYSLPNVPVTLKNLVSPFVPCQNTPLDCKSTNFV
jgi:hypothetical protein